jgi:hypothetical protein
MAERAGAPKPKPVVRGKGATMLIYGVPGVGKTPLIGAPNTLIIRPPNDNTDSIREPEGVKEIVVQGWTDMLETFSWGQQGGFDEFDWVWLDSVSGFQDVGLYDLFEDAVARKPARKEFGADKQEYGLNQFRLTTWVRNMVGFAKETGKINFGMTAWPMEWYDPNDEETKWAPMIQGSEGKVMLKVCGMFNTIAYYHEAKLKGESVRVLRTKGYGDLPIVARDQLDLFPKGRIVNPTMADINSAIASKREATTRRKTRQRRTK